MGGVELSLALATYEANRKFVEARTTNAQLDPYFRGIDSAVKVSNAIRSWFPGGGATLGVDKFSPPRDGSRDSDSNSVLNLALLTMILILIYFKNINYAY